MKKFLIILLVVVLVVIAAAVALIAINRDKLVAVAMDATMKVMEKEVDTQYSASAEADSVKMLLNEVAVAVKAGKADKAAFQSFIMTFKSDMKDNQLDSLEIQQLLELAKKIPQTE